MYNEKELELMLNGMNGFKFKGFTMNEKVDEPYGSRDIEKKHVYKFEEKNIDITISAIYINDKFYCIYYELNKDGYGLSEDATFWGKGVNSHDLNFFEDVRENYLEVIDVNENDKDVIAYMRELKAKCKEFRLNNEK